MAILQSNRAEKGTKLPYNLFHMKILYIFRTYPDG
jgi:hypothetical protein